MKNSGQPIVNVLAERARIQAHVFSSDTPIVGSLIVWLRNFWYGMAAKWAVQAVVQQQNAFNALLVERIEALEVQLATQDRELVQLKHDHAETMMRVGQLNRRLAVLEVN